LFSARPEDPKALAVTVGGFGFPHAAQVIQVTRKTRDLGARRWRTMTVYAATLGITRGGNGQTTDQGCSRRVTASSSEEAVRGAEILRGGCRIGRLRYTAGPQAAMTELDTLAGALDRYHLYHATRAELLRDLGHADRPAPPTGSPSS
jgi:hypothetical protein